MIFKKKLCYGCYQKVSRMHNAKNCTNRKVCEVCNGKHPTTLHGLVLRKDNSQKKSEKQNVEERENQNVSGNQRFNMCISECGFSSYNYEHSAC